MNVAEIVTEVCRDARGALPSLARAGAACRTRALREAASALRAEAPAILSANAKDMAAAREQNLSPALLDRLALDDARIEAMARGVAEIAELPDPLGAVLDAWERPSGLSIRRVRVPLGVVAVIYESRPNVTADAAALTLKAGNAVILRGGSESTHSSEQIVYCLNQGLAAAGLSEASIQRLPTQDREAMNALIRRDDLIDVLIPRGGHGLIHYLDTHATIPMLRHLQGICHTYVHAAADIDKAVAVCVNAKMRRPGICGATETILVDQQAAGRFVAPLVAALEQEGCTVRVDDALSEYAPSAALATEADWATEYLAPVVSVKSVNGVEEAIAHIHHYGSGHTEAILTEDQAAAARFLNGADSAIVMHNTSTQFADGGEFGMGAEIGIATGKLHARGPVGVEQLTTYKYQVSSDGAVRQ